MKAETTDNREEPKWVSSDSGQALVVRCGTCYDHPGSRCNDGSGPCYSCDGSGWIVLATSRRENKAPDPDAAEGEG